MQIHTHTDVHTHTHTIPTMLLCSGMLDGKKSYQCFSILQTKSSYNKKKKEKKTRIISTLRLVEWTDFLFF